MRAMLLAAGAAMMTLGGCGDEGDGTGNESAAVPESQDVAEALDDAGDLSIAAELVDSAGLEKMLEGVGSYTLFLPVDQAFEAVPADQLTMLKSDEGRPQLVALLSQHIAPGFINRPDLDAGLARANGSSTLATMGSAPLALRKVGDTVTLGEGEDAPKIVGTPVVARNGVIYRIDRIIPPGAGE